MAPFGETNFAIELAQEAEAKKAIEIVAVGEVDRSNAKISELMAERPETNHSQEVATFLAYRRGDVGGRFT